MNAWKVALFIFLVQSGIYLVTLANIPLTCDDTGDTCVYFSADTLRSTDMSSIITDTIDSGQFSSAQLTVNIFSLDTLTFVATLFRIMGEFIYMSVFGIYSLILFAFGNGAVSAAFAIIAQAIVFYFYGRLLVDVFRPGSRGET